MKKPLLVMAYTGTNAKEGAAQTAKSNRLRVVVVRHCILRDYGNRAISRVAKFEIELCSRINGTVGIGKG